MSRVEKTDVIMCRSADRWDYATFVVVQRYDDETPDRGYFMLAIESSFGNGYAYAWGNPGPDFVEFLAGQLDAPWYVAGKMCQGDPEVVDWEESTRRCKRRILEMRRAGDCTADEARAAWPDSEFESEGEFWVWAREQDVVTDVHEEIVSRPGYRYNQFMGLHKMFWAEFATQLRAAKAKEAA